MPADVVTAIYPSPYSYFAISVFSLLFCTILDIRCSQWTSCAQFQGCYTHHQFLLFFLLLQITVFLCLYVLPSSLCGILTTLLHSHALYLPPACSILKSSLLRTPRFLFLSFSWTDQMIRACLSLLFFFFLPSKNIPDHILINSTCHRMVRSPLIYFPYPPPPHSPSVHCSLLFFLSSHFITLSPLHPSLSPNSPYPPFPYGLVLFLTLQ